MEENERYGITHIYPAFIYCNLGAGGFQEYGRGIYGIHTCVLTASFFLPCTVHTTISILYIKRPRPNNIETS